MSDNDYDDFCSKYKLTLRPLDDFGQFVCVLTYVCERICCIVTVVLLTLVNLNILIPINSNHTSIGHRYILPVMKSLA